MTGQRIAIIGSTGQVARALMKAGREAGVAVVSGGRPSVDATDYRSVATFLYENQPSIVVNAAAYTAVDKAESEPEAAFRLNAEAPARLAVLCAAAKVPLVHLSTDYVFDGTKAEPYVEDDQARPLSVYGASKAAGEDAVRTGTPLHVILRTSWVYDAEGQNFVRTMLRLGAERDELSVVADQHGAPTAARDLARAIVAISEAIRSGTPANPWGTYHLASGGETTWHGFADEIFRLAAENGRKTPRLVAIPSSEYPLPARRPQNSRLDCGKARRTFGIALPEWRDALAGTMRELLAAQPAA